MYDPEPLNEDRIYQDGIEDTAYKVLALIRGSNYEVTPYDIEAFLEAEIGWAADER